MNNLNIVKVDLDFNSRKKVMDHLKERLSYFHDLGFLNFNKIASITIIRKKRYSVKIILKFNVKTYNSIVLLECLLGSDYRKGVNEMINHHLLNMEYSNRLFTIKRYKGEGFIVAKTEDITLEIMDYIYLGHREKWKN